MYISGKIILYKCKGKGSVIIINQEDDTIMHYSHKKTNALQTTTLKLH